MFLEKLSTKVHLNLNWRNFYNMQNFVPAVPSPELLDGLLCYFCSPNRSAYMTDFVTVFCRETPGCCFSQRKANVGQLAFNTRLAWL